MEDKKEKPTSTNINWYPGHMAKTKRQIENDLKLIDVVIELIDSRIPISSRNPDIKKLISNKKRVIVLNKSDMADDGQNKKWAEKLSKEAPTVIADCNSGKGVDKISKKIDELMKDEIEKQKARGRINKTIRVMILGIPNVGKSTLINKMAKSNRVAASNKPGVTRQNQWIRISKNQELLDTPGVLWPKFNDEVGLNLAYTGSIKDDILETTEIAYELLKKLVENYKDDVLNRYNITKEEYEDILKNGNPTYELMQLIARKRGALVQGGTVDEEKVARIIINDFRTCKIGRITLERI